MLNTKSFLVVSLKYLLLMCTYSHLGFCIFVMFSIFRDEMQYMFSYRETSSSWSFFEDAGVVSLNTNEISFVSNYKNTYSHG